MSGFNLKRKMKRTKQQELKVVESGNRQGIFQLQQQLFGLSRSMVDLQKNYLALLNVLKQRGIVDDLMLHRALGEIEEYERMQKMAIKIDPNKAAPVEPVINIKGK